MYSDGVRQTFVRSVAGTVGAGALQLRAQDAMAAEITAMKLHALFAVSITTSKAL